MASGNFSQALGIVSGASSMSEAVEVFQVFGLQFLLALAVPLMVLVALGAVVEGGRGRKMWDYKGYWMLVGFVILADVMMMFLIPFMISSF